MEDDDSKTLQIRKSQIGVELPASEPTTLDHDSVTLAAPMHTPSESSLSGARPILHAQSPTMKRQFGRYELLLELAAGGMATLYLARLRGPEGFEKLIALKIIHGHLTREQSFVRMFYDEARISALVHHPNVVQVLDLGHIDDTHYIAMEYVHGKDYRAVLKGSYRLSQQNKPLSSVPDWLIATRVAADAAAGLHAAHELVSANGEPLGLVHRDVSPHNILLSYDGHVKLTDFGIAYAKQRFTHTDSGVLEGTLAYMSPEQAEGTTVDRRADVFALGIVLWEAVCNKRLFRRKTDAATIYALTQAEIPRPRSVREDLPAELEQIILRSLARRPGVRYQTAQELGRALEQLIARHDDIIGAAELGTVMSTLFTQQRAKLDEEISEAMAEADAEPAPNADVATHERTDTNLADVPSSATKEVQDEPPSETRMSAQVLRSVPEPSHRNTPMRIGVIALASMLAVGMGWYLLTRKPPQEQTPNRSRTGQPTLETSMKPPEPRERPRTRPAPRPPAMRRVPAKLVITFVVTPARARATILFRGKRYRQNRLELFVTAGETTERVRVEAPGFHPTERFVTVRPETTSKHELKLKPRWRRPGMPPKQPDGMDMAPRPVDIGFD